MTTKRERERRMERVLDYFLRVQDGATVTEKDVGAVTGIGDAALPLLADLVRRGWLAYEYEQRGGRPRLCYRLTEVGRRALADRGA